MIAPIIADLLRRGTQAWSALLPAYHAGTGRVPVRCLARLLGRQAHLRSSSSLVCSCSPDAVTSTGRWPHPARFAPR